MPLWLRARRVPSCRGAPRTLSCLRSRSGLRSGGVARRRLRRLRACALPSAPRLLYHGCARCCVLYFFCARIWSNPPPVRRCVRAPAQVISVVENNKSTVHNEAVAALVGQVVEKFGAARLRLGAVLDYLCGPAGVGCVQPKARAAAIGALCAVYKQMGPALRIQVETRSVSAAVMTELTTEFGKVRRLWMSARALGSGSPDGVFYRLYTTRRWQRRRPRA